MAYTRDHTSPVGTESIDWRRGRPYIRVKQADGSWEWKHRLVMKQQLGRDLKPGEKVYFVNGNSQDCRPENLEAKMPNRGNLHRYKRKARLQAAIRQMEFKKQEVQDILDGLNEQLKEFN